jgi:AI-2E family transporter
LLLYWSWQVVGPFVSIALWSAILTVALYPLFDWLARQLGSRRLAPALITLLSMLIVIGPVTWLGFGLIGTGRFVVRGVESETSFIPLPDESVKNWPLIGEQAYRLWTHAATDIKSVIVEAAPMLKPLGGGALNIAGTVVLGLLQFVAAIVVAGFLYSPGPQLARSLGAMLHRIFGSRSEDMLKLAMWRPISRPWLICGRASTGSWHPRGWKPCSSNTSRPQSRESFRICPISSRGRNAMPSGWSSWPTAGHGSWPKGEREASPTAAIIDARTTAPTAKESFARCDGALIVSPGRRSCRQCEAYARPEFFCKAPGSRAACVAVLCGPSRLDRSLLCTSNRRPRAWLKDKD